MAEKDLIKDIKPKSETLKVLQKYVLNKYVITIFLFLVWMIFFDKTSFLVINELNGEINKYEDQLEYYKSEYKKNDDFYKKLMNNKSEKEKFAR
ncbi:septum formation initiator family protein, partial [Chryseobacterium sp.]|uniref:septum formation initiator family protein n=1 Tax=Chryseobacterium sp. TaxID=1871047 RepID=UPI0025C0C737